MQVASQTKVTAEKYGPNDERQEVGSEERELLTRHHFPRIQNSSATGQEDDQGQNQERKEILGARVAGSLTPR